MTKLEPNETTTGSLEPVSRISMEPLYQRLLKKGFPDSISAIEYCRDICAEYGFTIKQEASANKNIYVYCSREGLPDSQRNPKPSPQRKRPSKRCDCRWRIVLSENEQERWEFRKSLTATALEHNHEMMSPEEMVKAWPPEVSDMIIRLAQQRLQTHEIREAVKQYFPDITWNERRFYNRLTEERKRIRQRGVIERSQRLLLLSARLCSIVAGNEGWAICVENDLARMFDNFCQLTRLTPEAIESLVDMQPNQIQSYTSPEKEMQTHRLAASTTESNMADPLVILDASPSSDLEDLCPTTPSAKRRKSNPKFTEAPKGTQVVPVPAYTLFVRSQPLRSPSDASSQSSRRTAADSPTGLDSHSPQNIPPPTFNGASTASFFTLTSPTSSASSSSSMAFPRHYMDMPQQRSASTSQHVSTAHSAPTSHGIHNAHSTPTAHNAHNAHDAHNAQCSYCS
ncbi:hypothetical protein BDF14DRAFT_500650 [Spinellus fusiger]|nr:hypothetical protein BDF14DRAFT_500650 [Spinellus fusiger]